MEIYGIAQNMLQLSEASPLAFPVLGWHHIIWYMKMITMSRYLGR